MKQCFKEEFIKLTVCENLTADQIFNYDKYAFTY